MDGCGGVSAAVSGGDQREEGGCGGAVIVVDQIVGSVKDSQQAAFCCGLKRKVTPLNECALRREVIQISYCM